jgi:hypothetical protein
MHKFLCTHSLPVDVFTRKQVREMIETSQHEANLRGYRAFINFTEGKACCVIEAENRDTVLAWFSKMRIPFDAIVAVEFESERGVIEDLR